LTHCGIRLVNCKVPPENILGAMGDAYNSIALPFRDAEDLLIMGPILGGMSRQLGLILDAIHIEKINLKPELIVELGLIKSFIHAIRTLACEAAVMMDAGPLTDNFTYIVLAMKTMAGQHLDRVEKFYTHAGLQETPEWKSLKDDLIFAVRLAENVRRMRTEKQGNIILNKKVSI
jgi:hypothetical protein